MQKHIIIAIFLVISAALTGQKKMTRLEYIDTYKELAMQEMVTTGIPASITLAQGILESGNGNSTLATKANNHFGIKCHGWKGKSVRHDDDARNECFRKYNSVEESYRDHSEFLTTRGRYSSLFELKSNDYKGWARGLKKAGYATSPTYSKALIKLIEDNKLYEYDSYVLANKDSKWKKTEVAKTHYAGNRKIKFNNRVKYIIGKQGDTYTSLATELDLLDWQLPKYNETTITSLIENGDTVYIQPKRKKADVKHKSHIVKKGETIQSIAQQYAIRADQLRKRNLLADNAEPKAGTLLLLRKRKKGSITTETIKEQLEGSNQQPVSEFQVEIEN